MARITTADIKPSDYKKELHLRIDWSEMDVFGHVNNLTFMKYQQAARVNLWEHIGMGDRINESGQGVMLASTGCQFLKPLLYPGRVQVRTKVSFIKNSSFGFDHIILNQEGEIAATGSDVMVYFDFHKAQKLDIPDRFRKALAEFE